MPHAVVNPDELERFTRELKQFNKDVDQLLKTITYRFNRVGETWKDEQHQRFAAEFAQTTKILRQFIASSDKHLPVLTKKAEFIRAYQNQR